MATCPKHGWTLIQKFRSEPTGPNCERVYPIDEWWCRTCGYENPVAGSPSAASPAPQEPRETVVSRLPRLWRQGAATLRASGDTEKAEWAESYAAQLETCLEAQFTAAPSVLPPCGACAGKGYMTPDDAERAVQAGSELYQAGYEHGKTLPPSVLPQGWQPISTAPKDEDVIVAAPLRSGGVGVGEARQQGDDGWWWANTYGEYCGAPIHPTHWMPLPPDPSALLIVRESTQQTEDLGLPENIKGISGNVGK